MKGSRKNKFVSPYEFGLITHKISKITLGYLGVEMAIRSHIKYTFRGQYVTLLKTTLQQKSRI